MTFCIYVRGKFEQLQLNCVFICFSGGQRGSRFGHQWTGGNRDQSTRGGDFTVYFYLDVTLLKEYKSLAYHAWRGEKV